MKAKSIVFLLISLFLTTAANAVPAKPGQIRQITLDDGTTLTVHLVGDEYGHYWLADDGKAYRCIGDSYVPVDRQSVNKRAQIRRNAANSRRARLLEPGIGQKNRDTYIGHKKGLIIMANFANLSFKEAHTDSLYNEIANHENYKSDLFEGSMYDYFRDQSRGQFLLNFDIAGPVTVSKDYEYYGANDSEGQDSYTAEMVIEAIQLADSLVNFSDYDWDGDGIVDQVFVIYAGEGEADGGAAETIWPHEYTLTDAFLNGDGSGIQFLDGVYIDTYACGCELSKNRIAGIGTICHEFSHCLGYPDFYDIDYSGGQGMYSWDLMDSGSWNRDGYLPSGFTSYERWFAGWMEPTVLSETTTVDSLADLQSGGGSYIIYNKGYRNEYYLLENRKKTGWDAAIPGAGLFIIHVDYDEEAWRLDIPNDDPEHQRMTWIPADNEYQTFEYDEETYIDWTGATKDLFPYDSVNAFNANTTPAAKFYNRNADGTFYLDSSVEDITQNSDGTVSFKFIAPTTTGIPTVNAKPGAYNDNWYDMNGRRIDGVPGSPGLYFGNGNKVLIK